MIKLSKKEYKKIFKKEKKEKKKKINQNIRTATQIIKKKEKWNFKEICIKTFLLLGVVYFTIIIIYLTWVFLN